MGTETAKPLKWLANVVLRGIIGGARILPFHKRSALGGRITTGFGGRISGFRKRTERNLNYIFPDMPVADRDRIAHQVLDNSGRTIFENFYPEDFGKHHPDVHIWGDGLQTLLDAHKDGRSIVLVSGHFGNHEAMRLALFQQGVRVGGMYRPMSNKYFNPFYVRCLDVDGRSGPLFTADRAGTRGFRRALKDGGVCLALLIDLAVPKGSQIDFLGKPAMTSTSAAAFALESGALYIPYFSMRNADRRSFSVEIAAPIEGETALDMTELATRELEKRIAADPGNWFWVHRRWKPFFR